MLPVALLWSFTTALDLTQATVDSSEPIARQVLIEEIERRAGMRWGDVAGGSTIRIRRGNGPADGYRIETVGRTITVTGNDARGALFGTGYLLRQLRISRGRVEAPDSLSITTAPRYPLRGHQLGFRPKTNSYDGFTAAMWDQYIRELAIFGTNAVELIPPRSDDDADSPHFPIPQMPMMVEMSKSLAKYGLDCWIWYPALDNDYSKPEQVEAALKEWGEVFRQLPKVDAIFVPGGDPGHTPPEVLFPFLEKQAANLRKYHPKAQLWVAPQGFRTEWMERFFKLVRTEPAWLTGIVYGPQTRLTIDELRAAIPRRYPLRHYPDITHLLDCQFPVPDWDTALAQTHDREAINPRPVDQRLIFQRTQPATMGFLSYSEGVNDDINKIIWSVLGWNPEADLTVALREYGRFFIGPAHDDAIAQLILALERNWRGPLLTNGGVRTTLQQAQSLERTVSPAVKQNWRFQSLIYRAYFDAYQQARLFHFLSAEDWANDQLRRAPETGSLIAMSSAESILDRAHAEPVAVDLRQRVFSLAEALFQSIRMQTSSTMHAGDPGRGTTLDSVEYEVNNRPWLKQEFARIRQLAKEQDRLAALRALVEWENPGPGGFYDDLGDPSRQPHLVRPLPYGDDPSYLKSSIVGFTSRADRPDWRMSWLNYAASNYDTPLEMKYEGLDPAARYRIRIVYAGERSRQPLAIRLVADTDHEVHPAMEKKVAEPVEFDVPPAATRDGAVTFRWIPTAGRGGNGRGLQIAEVWLLRR